MKINEHPDPTKSAARLEATTMTKFHINPETGTPGLCSASARSCPFGGESDHYPTAAQARAAFENTQRNLKSIGSTPFELSLGEIIDLDLLKKMQEERFVYASIHPDDDSYVLYCYTPMAQIKGKWNDVTKMARGLIIRRGESNLSDASVIARPWSKFFTLSQQERGWHLGDEENPSSAEDAFSQLDFDAPAEVYDKVDGSLGILYKAPDGLPALATKGSFASPQALEYTEFLRGNEDTLLASQGILSRKEDSTALFELVGPENRIVLAYERKEIVLLGGAKKINGDSLAPEEIFSWAGAGLPVVEKVGAKTLREALALPPREGKEGTVVSIGGPNPMKIKIKQDDYQRLHRIVTMFSKKESRALVMDLAEDATAADLLRLAKTRDVGQFETIRQVLEIDGFSKGDADFEFIRSKREGYFKEILLPRAEKMAEAKAVIDALDEDHFTREAPAKRFAELVKTLPGERTQLFQFFRARLDGKKPEELSAFHEIRRAISDVKDK